MAPRANVGRKWSWKKELGFGIQGLKESLESRSLVIRISFMVIKLYFYCISILFLLYFKLPEF